MTGASEAISVGALTIRFRLEGHASGGSVAAFEFDVPAAAAAPPAHSHDGYEETIYGLAGTLTWTVGDERIRTAPGDVLCIPRGVVHRFENQGDTVATSLAIVTPGVLGPDFFRELSDVVSASDGPPDPTAMGAVMRRHGLTPAAP